MARVTKALKDTAKVLSEYADIIMLRTSNHNNLKEFAKFSEIPLINGLSEKGHPCQILSDILTFEETKGEIKRKNSLHGLETETTTCPIRSLKHQSN